MQLNSAGANHVLTRLDNGIVLQLVHNLERDSTFLPFLQVFANPALFRWGERVYLDYRDSYGQGKHSDTISVRAAEPLLEVLAWTETPQSFSALLARLIDAYPDKDGEQLESFLHSLLDQNILLSTLRPPLSDPDPLNNLARALPSAYEGPVRSQVEELKAGLDTYNRISLGHGLPILKDLYDRAREIGATQSHHFQVDTRVATKEAVMPTSLSEEVSRAVIALLRVWPLSKTPRQ